MKENSTKEIKEKLVVKTSLLHSEDPEFDSPQAHSLSVKAGGLT